MKTFLTLIFLSIAAHASTIFIDSGAFDSNDSGDPTVDLSGILHRDPSWAPALPGSMWISYGSTGFPNDPGHFTPPDGTVVTFATQFILSGPITQAYLIVQADGTASVNLNGHLLTAAATIPVIPCPWSPLICVSSTESIFTFGSLEPYLTDGPNALSFAVTMTGGESFGLDFAGRIDTSDTAPTPEPSTLAFIGGGLLALAILRRRR
ncbi:MAG: PEP-CTERM sorting domain-containing protein [Bryobacteraceae bacterium]